MRATRPRKFAGDKTGIQAKEVICVTKHNWMYCLSMTAQCPCLKCNNDRCVNDPTTETKCCDLAGHARRCKDTFRRVDFEPEKARNEEIAAAEKGTVTEK